MPTLTPNYNLNKPLVNNPTDQDLWGGYNNDNFDTIDGQLLVSTNDITRAISTNTTLTSADQNKLILVDASGGDVTITLPPSVDGFRVAVKKVSSGSNNVIIDGASSETIDGELTQTLSTQYEITTIVGDGSNWSITQRSVSFVDAALTGTPTAPTAAAETDTTQIATCKFVHQESIGWGQTWQDVKASRSIGSTYTNTSGKPIQISVAVKASSTGSALDATLTVGGVVVAQNRANADLNGTGWFQHPTTLQAIVPEDATYVVSGTMTILYWAELR